MSNDYTFKLDKGFLKELHRRLTKENNEDFAINSKWSIEKFKLPNLKQLEEIISAMFWASTQLEEGRLLRFRVSYQLPHDFTGHLGLGFRLSSFKSWNAEEIKKLAPAVVPPNGEICVYPFMNKLYIQGLTTRTMFGLTFEIIDPARMIIRFGLMVADITGQKAEFVNFSWYSSACKLMSTYESDEKNEHIFEMLSFLYGEMTREILSRIRLLKHGGTIIFVPDDNKWKKSVEKPMSYECKYRLNGIQFIDNELTLELQSIAVGKTEEESKDEIHDSAMKKITSLQYKNFIADAARSVAYLTAVDGAVIMNKNFDVLAFGAKIKEMQKGRKAQMITKITPYESDVKPRESALTHEFRGKRHLSTARFILNNLDSIAFTVSQDGGITGFMVEDGKLLAYKGLELLL